MQQNLNGRKCILGLIVALAMMSSAHVYSQPYAFPVNRKFDPTKPEFEQIRDYSLLKMNLRNGNVDTLISGAGTIRGLFEGGDQRKVFLEYEGSIVMVDIGMPDLEKSLSIDATHRVSGFLDAYRVGRVYFTMRPLEGNDSDAHEYTLVIDRNTFARLDSSSDYLVALRPSGEPIDFLSRDHRYIYRRIVQKGTVSFDVYSTSTQTRVGVKTCPLSSLIRLGPAFEWGRDGVAVMRFAEQNMVDFVGQQFLVWDIDMEAAPQVIPFPFRSEAMLSADGKKLVIQELPWKEGKGPEPTGRFVVFDATSGKLLQEIAALPGSHIYTYDTFPSELFLFNAVSGHAQAINTDAEITVGALLDTLVSLKHGAADNSWLADANFVNELDNGLENAKKHLAKGDSVNCYKEVQTFQDKVNKEYQKTVDNEKKGKPRDKRFVTVEGWKFLYYNAQYIMDRLPAKK